jgi:hypothetical protein
MMDSQSAPAATLPDAYEIPRQIEDTVADIEKRGGTPRPSPGACCRLRLRRPSMNWAVALLLLSALVALPCAFTRTTQPR